MISDDIRNRTFREGLRAAIRPGSVVLDVGAGTGILSLYAAQAGARRVYAVERTGMSRLARQLAYHHGFGHTIQIIESDIETAWLPEPCDVIVSEWLGTIGLDEHLLAPVLLARDRWLKPGGAMLPHIVRTWVAPVYAGTLAHEWQALCERDDGLDLSLLAQAASDEFIWQQSPAPNDQLLGPAQVAWQVNTLSCTTERARLPFRAALRFQASQKGRVNALCMWFDATFPPHGHLSNAPAAQPTHWGQYLLPLLHSHDVSRGTPIDVTIAYLPLGFGQGAHTWTVRCGNHPAEQHDTRRVWW